jgi:hypothetical protein
MSLATAVAAVFSSAKVLVLFWPVEPMRPQRAVRELADWDISQNLLEESSVNSK